MKKQLFLSMALLVVPMVMFAPRHGAGHTSIPSKTPPTPPHVPNGGKTPSGNGGQGSTAATALAQKYSSNGSDLVAGALKASTGDDVASYTVPTSGTAFTAYQAGMSFVQG